MNHLLERSTEAGIEWRWTQVNPKYNGELIGPGGKNIRKMKEDFGIENIDLDQDGTISILGSPASTEACAEYIKLRTTEPEVRLWVVARASLLAFPRESTVESQARWWHPYMYHPQAPSTHGPLPSTHSPLTLLTLASPGGQDVLQLRGEERAGLRRVRGAAAGQGRAGGNPRL